VRGKPTFESSHQAAEQSIEAQIECDFAAFFAQASNADDQRRLSDCRPVTATAGTAHFDLCF
jgi:hypothetical protein